MQDKKIVNKSLLTPERGTFLIPILISLALSGIFLFSLIIPQYRKSSNIFFEIVEYKRKKDQFSDLKNQYKIINSKFENQLSQKIKILKLITGDVDLKTLLWKIEELSTNNDLFIITLEPKSYTTNVPIEVKNTNKSITPDIEIGGDPLVVEGVTKFSIDLSLQGNFVNFLSFLRDLEKQENIIISKNLNIQENQEGDIQASMQIDVYGYADKI